MCLNAIAGDFDKDPGIYILISTFYKLLNTRNERRPGRHFALSRIG